MVFSRWVHNTIYGSSDLRGKETPALTLLYLSWQWLRPAIYFPLWLFLLFPPILNTPLWLLACFCRHFSEASEFVSMLHTSSLLLPSRFLQTQIWYIMILYSGSVTRKIACASHCIQDWQEFVLIMHHWIRKLRGYFNLKFLLYFFQLFFFFFFLSQSEHHKFVNTNVWP